MFFKALPGLSFSRGSSWPFFVAPVDCVDLSGEEASLSPLHVIIISIYFELYAHRPRMDPPLVHSSCSFGFLVFCFGCFSHAALRLPPCPLLLAFATIKFVRWFPCIKTTEPFSPWSMQEPPSKNERIRKRNGKRNIWPWHIFSSSLHSPRRTLTDVIVVAVVVVAPSSGHEENWTEQRSEEWPFGSKRKRLIRDEVLRMTTGHNFWNSHHTRTATVLSKIGKGKEGLTFSPLDVSTRYFFLIFMLLFRSTNLNNPISVIEVLHRRLPGSCIQLVCRTYWPFPIQWMNKPIQGCQVLD